MHELNAELLGPQPALGAFESAIDTTGRFGIARPEHDDLGMLEAVRGRAVKARRAQAQAVAVVMHGPPVPAFPADRTRFDAGEADQVAEAQKRAQVVVDVSPLVV